MKSIPSFFLTLLIASLAGYAGGFAASNSRAAMAAVSPVRSNRFELARSDGSVVAFWGFEHGASKLLFLARSGRTAAEIQVPSDGSPSLSLFGQDGKPRIVLQLNSQDKPFISLSDERWFGRVHLGIVDPDTPVPAWDNWGLLFRIPGSERPIAAIGVNDMPPGKPEGAVTISGRRIR